MDHFTILDKDFELTTDPDKVDFQKLHHLLAFESYWNQNIPKDLLQKALQNSLNFSIIDKKNNQFTGFARIITDYATFAYLCDVIIDPTYRGNGLGKWLIKTIMIHPELQGLRFWFLMTRDAHELYSKSGWKPIQNPQNAMGIKIPALELYKPLKEDKE